MGNAVYSDFMVVQQNVTVNTSEDISGNPAPKLGRGLYLSAGAKIIGNQSIGDWVTVGVDTCVYKTQIESNMIIYKDYNGIIQIKPQEKEPAASVYFFGGNNEKSANICK